MYSIYFIIIKNLSCGHYSDWYSHWDLVGRPSIQKSNLLGCLSCLIEQWHIFYWSVLLGFGWAYSNISQLFSTPPFPPRHQWRSLVSPPRPCLLSSTCGAARVSWIHNGSQSLGVRFLKNPPPLSLPPGAWAAWVPLNTTSQSHLSPCVKQSSIHPPDKVHTYLLPLQTPEVLNLLPYNSPPHLPLQE